MPSPFPGVDPYIEDQHFWPDFHQSFMTYWRDQLLEVLPDNYDARLEERVHQVAVSDEPLEQSRFPDITLSKSGAAPRRAARSAGGTLVLEPITMTLPEYEEAREAYIKVTHRPDRSLVAILELLSPSNKVLPGFGDYLSKRTELLCQDVHVVEVDLLLGGRRLPMRKGLPPADFYAIVSRSQQRPQAEVFAWTLRDPLPPLPVPLRAPDQDLLVKLGEIFTLTYDRGRYGRILNYTKRLSLPLPAGDRRWAHQQVKTKRK